MKCGAESEQDLLAKYTQGDYCHACAQFDEQHFIDNWHSIYFIVFSFVRRFNLRDFQACNKDPVLSMIAAEIWLYNIGRLLRKRVPDKLSQALADENQRQYLLPKCNAYSLSQFLGIPNQTVRRKIDKLIEMGWVVKNAQGELAVSAKCEEAFSAEFNLETMRDFVSTARGAFTLLGLETTAAAPDPSDS